ncbi:nucleoside/nucleotide kinase family protein [Paracoccus aurantiacus]|uniref:Nucleoside/nucleotide kinase family protein n=1 Tax=Paracoccus aurantiacus TaxID=2599412 RepID=A0A5C6RYL3_9RHOB|nr:nucleoside/nucleotide kinase family protein [Paracoccus aurantiacus]TXB67706.1 nucleoside/nucleotide kinase family protein [Paracoccus aurantiacus]
MSEDVDFEGLLSLCKQQLDMPGRRIVAIVGAPGSGKSTLVEKLAESLGDIAAILPMDGFHYDDGLLHQMGRRPWKGAPDTYDVGGLRSALIRLRDPGEGAVAVPVFDRDLEISRGSARIIPSEARIILVEGNYLLLNDAPWPSLRPLFDVTVRIEVPEDELRRRLTKRWVDYGLTEAEIAFKLDENDLPNGRMAVNNSISPDYLLHPS